MALSTPVAEIVRQSSDPLLGKHDFWERVPLAEVAEVLNGFAFKSSRFNKKKGQPLIRIRDVGKDSAEVLYDGPCEERYVIEQGDLLIGMDGDFNSGRWKGPAGLLNQRVCKVELKSEHYSPGFLELVLPGYLKAINQKTSAVTVKHLSSKSLQEIPLPLPPLNEQHRIVEKIEELFTKLDAGVRSLKQARAQLKSYRRSVLKAAVEGELSREWREAHRDELEPALELLERILRERREKFAGKKYKEPAYPDTSELPLLPEGWTWATLPQLGELNRGKSKHRPRNASFLYGGPYPFVQTGDIREAEGTIRSFRQSYTEEGLKQSRLWPKGTLCITIAANIADTALLGFDACFPDSVVGFLPEAGHCSVAFVEYFMRTARERLDRYAPATAQKNINVQTLNGVAVPLPPLQEQHVIVDQLDRSLSIVAVLEATVEASLKQANALRQSILKRAFTGELVLQDPDDEPASALLERIREERRAVKQKTGRGRRARTSPAEHEHTEQGG